MAGVVLVVGIALTCRRRGGSTLSTAPRGGMQGVAAQAAAAQKGKQLPIAGPAAAPLPKGKGLAPVAGAVKGGAAAPFKAVIPAAAGKGAAPAAAPAAAPPGKAAAPLPGKAAAPAAAPLCKAATLQGVATAATAATASKGAPPAAKPPPPRHGSGKK